METTSAAAAAATTNLLERLRRRDVVVAVDPVTCEEAELKVRLIVDHRSEFPSPLRRAINSALSATGEQGCDTAPERFWFLSEVYEAVKSLFLAHRRDGEESNEESAIAIDGGDDASSSPSSSGRRQRCGLWRGLDGERDTEDQVELAIRIFPAIFTETIPDVPMSRISPAIGCWFARAEAVSFVPLAVRLRSELLGLVSPRFLIAKQLLIPGKRTFEELFRSHNRDATGGGNSGLDASSLFGPEEEETLSDSDDLDEASLSVLVRMGEMGLVNRKEDANYLLKWLLTRAHHHHHTKNRREFAEARLRLMIDWDPTVLRVFRHGDTPLVSAFDCYYPRCSEDDDAFLFLALFERIVERGMAYFPDELGFVFHASSSSWIIARPDDDDGSGSSAFRSVSSRHGGKAAAIVRRQLLESGRSVRCLVVAAAVNDRIGLDGVYLLARADPAGLIPSGGTSGGR